MPIGSRHQGTATGPQIPPRLLEAGPGGDAALSAQLAVGDSDDWQHDTIGVTAAEWPATITWSGQMMRVEIFAGAGDALYIGLDRDAAPGVGGYDLFHPGGGQLVAVIPPTSRITLRTVAGGVPAARVEVTAHAGSYALR